MKKKVILMNFLFSALFVMIMAGCTKQGVLGPQGVPGKDGTTILTGDDVPSASMGATGDFFLDTAALVLYGPKTDSGWEDGISLKGTPGTQILRGNGAPDQAAGENGDYYFDGTDGELFGPKSDAGWGEGFSLNGPQDPHAPAENTTVKVYTFSKDLQWEKYNIGDGTYTYQIHKYLNDIDSTVLAEGAVMMYVKLSDDYWFQLPFWFDDINYYCNFSDGVFTIYVPRATTSPEIFKQIKLVITMGTSVENVERRPPVTFSDYLRAASAIHRKE